MTDTQHETTDRPAWHVPAPLIRAPAERSAEDLLKLARAAAYDPRSLDERSPFFALARPSNDALDAYFTRMHASTLKNFAAEAAAGVTVLASHNSRTLGIGRSLTGVVVKGQGDEPTAVLSDFYTVPGLRLGDVSTDDAIEGIRTGLIHDISVGFYGGTMQCSLCGRDLLGDWDCPHWPGLTYPTLDKQGNQIGEELAIAWIKDAHLAEYSLVYDGATPGAAIVMVKAVREAEAGRLKPDVARLLEARYRISLPGSSRRFAGAAGTATIDAAAVTDVIRHPETPASVDSAAVGDESGEVPDMAETDERTAPEPAQAGAADGLTRLLTARGAVQAGETPIDALTRLLDEAERLRALADDGRAYRADLIAEALAEGVRASGDTFAQETYRAVLESSPIEVIKRMRDDWAAVAAKQFPGGRLTVETEEQPATPAPPRIPDAAFRA